MDAFDLEALARLRVLAGPACRTARRLCHAASSYQASTPRSASDFRPGAVFSAFPGASRGTWAPCDAPPGRRAGARPGAERR
ncbi:hypothetical protein SSBG_05326 [Streptomyces sp. SPB074]|nr:hypothetical protein SSBG_05326 [Streptomyces sp. SPB074]